MPASTAGTARPDSADRSAPAAAVRAATAFHALSDETRLEILELLRAGERCVCDLQGVLGAGQSLLSFHLKTLRDAGLVAVRKDGRWAHYRLVPDGLAAVHDAIARLRQPKGRRLTVKCCG